MIFKELELTTDLAVELDKIIEKLDYNKNICDRVDYDSDLLPRHGLIRTSESTLQQILDQFKGTPTSGNVATADENMLRLPLDLVKESKLPNMFESFLKEVCQIGESHAIFHMTGRFWYPNNGFMGWHNNSIYPGFRFYCTHAQEANKSFFRYRNPYTKEIITSWDRSYICN